MDQLPLTIPICISVSLSTFLFIGSSIPCDSEFNDEECDERSNDQDPSKCCQWVQEIEGCLWRDGLVLVKKLQREHTFFEGSDQLAADCLPERRHCIVS